MKKPLTSLLALSIGFMPVPAIPQDSGGTVVVPPPPVPSLTSMRLEAITSRDLELLQALAAALRARHAALLTGTEILFTRVESHGTVFYRMDIQGIEDEQQALSICAVIEKDECLITRPGASQLAPEVQGLVMGSDGLVDVTGVAGAYGRQTSQSTEMQALPTVSGPPDAVVPSDDVMLRDQLGQLPMMRPQSSVPAVVTMEIDGVETEASAVPAPESVDGADEAIAPVVEMSLSELAPTTSIRPVRRPGAENEVVVAEPISEVPVVEMPVAPSAPLPSAPMGEVPSMSTVVPFPEGVTSEDADAAVVEAPVPGAELGSMLLESLPALASSETLPQEPMPVEDMPMLDGSIPSPQGEEILAPPALTPDDQSSLSPETLEAVLDQARRVTNMPNLDLRDEEAVANRVVEGLSIEIRNMITDELAQGVALDEETLTALIKRTLERTQLPTGEIGPRVAQVSGANGVVRSGQAASRVEPVDGSEAAQAALVFPATGVTGGEEVSALSDADLVQRSDSERLLRLPLQRPSAPTVLADAAPSVAVEETALVETGEGEQDKPSRVLVLAAPGVMPTEIAQADTEQLSSLPKVRPPVGVRVPQTRMEMIQAALEARRAEAAQVAAVAAQEALAVDAQRLAEQEAQTVADNSRSLSEIVDQEFTTESSSDSVDAFVSNVQVPDENTIRPRPRPAQLMAAYPDWKPSESVVVAEVVETDAVVASDTGVQVSLDAQLANNVAPEVNVPQDGVSVASSPADDAVLVDAQVAGLVQADALASASGEIAAPVVGDAQGTSGVVGEIALQSSPAPATFALPEFGEPVSGEAVVLSDVGQSEGVDTPVVSDTAQTVVPSQAVQNVPDEAPAALAETESPATVIAYVLPRPRPNPAPFALPEFVDENMVPVLAAPVVAEVAAPVVLDTQVVSGFDAQGDIASTMGDKIVIASPVSAPERIEGISGGMVAQETMSTEQVSVEGAGEESIANKEVGEEALVPVVVPLETIVARDGALGEYVLASVGASGSPVPVLPQAVVRPEPPNRAFFNRVLPSSPERQAGDDITEMFMASLSEESAEPSLELLASQEGVAESVEEAELPNPSQDLARLSELRPMMRPSPRPAEAGFALEETAQEAVVAQTEGSGLAPVLRPDLNESSTETSLALRDILGGTSLVESQEETAPTADAPLVLGGMADSEALLPMFRPQWQEVTSVAGLEESTDEVDGQEQVAVPAKPFGFVADSSRYRPELARKDDRPIHDFLNVFGTTLPLTEEQMATRGVIVELGPVDLAQTGTPIMQDVGTDWSALVPQESGETTWKVESSTPSSVLTLDEFIVALASGEVDFVVPATLDLATFAAENEAVSTDPMAGVDAGIQHAMAMRDRGLFPAQIVATVTEDGIEMATPEFKVVVPTVNRPLSRFAVALNDTYALPFDLTGSGQLRLQRMPIKRPQILRGDEITQAVAQAPVQEPTLELLSAREGDSQTDLSRFFPSPVEPLSQAPVSGDVRLDVGSAPSEEAIVDGLAQSLETLEMVVDENGLVDPLADVTEVTRPALNLPQVADVERPGAPAPVVPMETVQGEQLASLPPSAEVPSGFESAPQHDLRVNGEAFVPGEGSIIERDTRRVANERDESLMIRLSYSDQENIQMRIRELGRYFPQAMLDKGNFFGYAAPASPGLYILGIQAHNPVDMQDLVVYMNNNGIPYVLPGQSAAPLLTDPLAQSATP